MIRVLTFTADDKGKYVLLQDALQIGSAMLRQKKADDFGRDARRAETKIQRALRGIGEVVNNGDDPKPDAYGLEVDRRKRRLKDDGGEVRLIQPDFKRLCDYVEATPWLSDLSEHVTELQDWLEAAPQVKDE